MKLDTLTKKECYECVNYRWSWNKGRFCNLEEYETLKKQWKLPFEKNKNGDCSDYEGKQ